MKIQHISLIDLTIFHMGTASPQVVERITRHLDENCAECRAAYEFLGRLMGVMRRDRQASPPEAVLERARKIFHLVPAQVVAPLSPSERIAQLVFDSFREMAPAGVRGVFSPSRHMVFDDQGLVVELHIEPEASAERQAITGQLQSENTAPKQLEGLPIMLMEGEHVLMSTRTTAFGEFLFRHVPRRELCLLLVCADRMVKVPSIPPVSA